MDEARSVLLEYDWPGHVRESENVIERAGSIAEEKVISVEHIPFKLITTNFIPKSENPIFAIFDKATQEAKREVIQRTLHYSSSNDRIRQ